MCINRIIHPDHTSFIILMIDLNLSWEYELYWNLSITPVKIWIAMQIPSIDPKFQKYDIDLGDGRSHRELLMIFILLFFFFSFIMFLIVLFFKSLQNFFILNLLVSSYRDVFFSNYCYYDYEVSYDYYCSYYYCICCSYSGFYLFCCVNSFSIYFYFSYYKYCDY